MPVILLIMVLAAAPPIASDIKADEEVVFFPTCACLDTDQQHWNVPIHGWIFEPESDSIKRGMLLALLRRKLGLEAGQTESRTFNTRARTFLVDSERGKKVVVRFGAEQIVLDESGADGHFQTTLRAPEAVFRRLLEGQAVRDGWCRFRAITRPGDRRVFSGAVQLVEPTGVSVISDIDDTIKVSHVRDRKALVVSTFLLEFEAVPGMAALYEEWARAGARFHYVSASPWQLYVPLREFMDTKHFPPGSFHLRRLGWKDAALPGFLDSSEEYKLKTIEPLLQDFPRRQFILVGDSGESDPEIYGTIARKYPAQLVRIFIRNVTDEAADAERFTRAFEGVPRERWTVFRDAAEIRGKAALVLK